MKKIIYCAFLITILFTSCENKKEKKQAIGLKSEKQEILVDPSKKQIGSADDRKQEKSRTDEDPSQGKIKKSIERSQETRNTPNNKNEEYQDSYSSSNSIELVGIYSCSSEDMIRLNSNGTGKMIMSYSFDGVRSFTWDYDSDQEQLSITSEVPDDMKYEMLPIYMTLNLKMIRGRVAFEHYTSGPTFLYIKQ